MVRGVIRYLEASAGRHPDKTAFADKERSLTFLETWRIARSIGSSICESGYRRRPVAVFMEKKAESVAAFLGVVCGGCFYCPLDPKMPKERLDTILSVLQPAALITDRSKEEQVEALAYDGPVFFYEEISIHQDLGDQLDAVLDQVTEQDPLYVLFTSGSTGIPKGVLVGQRVVIDYLRWLEEAFAYSSEDVFGNQAPLYFDVSVHDIYGALYFGARMEIIPPSYFSFPVRLVEYMNERKVTTFLWVPSAMGMIANLDAFQFALPKYLRHVMFAGEVLPVKHLDYWVRYLPDAVYANLYGPTETFVCTAYVMDKEEDRDKPLPIGKPILNSRAVILDEEDCPVEDGSVGELCMKGSCLALGYYRDPERTAASFVIDPSNPDYPERIYRTGDLVRIDARGDLIYISRKDDQIKHMGYRIELGEIETAAAGVEGIRDCACIYDGEKKRICLCYDGRQLEKKELEQRLAKKLPVYMMPGRFCYYPALPHNANGKIDRKRLKEMQDEKN